MTDQEMGSGKGNPSGRKRVTGFGTGLARDTTHAPGARGYTMREDRCPEMSPPRDDARKRYGGN